MNNRNLINGIVARNPRNECSVYQICALAAALALSIVIVTLSISTYCTQERIKKELAKQASRSALSRFSVEKRTTNAPSELAKLRKAYISLEAIIIDQINYTERLSKENDKLRKELGR